MEEGDPSAIAPQLREGKSGARLIGACPASGADVGLRCLPAWSRGSTPTPVRWSSDDGGHGQALVNGDV